MFLVVRVRPSILKACERKGVIMNTVEVHVSVSMHLPGVFSKYSGVLDHSVFQGHQISTRKLPCCCHAATYQLVDGCPVHLDVMDVKDSIRRS